MGANQTKIEGEYLSNIPRIKEDLTISVDEINNPTELDPRSPNGCRTPINEIIKSKRNLSSDITVPQNDFNIIDPRSPSQFIDRTPIVFDKTGENIVVHLNKSLNLDDTFSDLSIDTVPPVSPKLKCQEIVEKRDPRSPTVDLERTPIIFTDDPVDEDRMIENVLDMLQIADVIENKHLERVKNPKKTAKSERRSRNSRSSPIVKKIYEDNEQICSTPKRNIANGSGKGTRTPLSCVANKSHLRSKSVENSAAKKPRIPLSSYDDQIIEKRHFNLVGNDGELIHAKLKIDFNKEEFLSSNF